MGMQETTKETLEDLLQWETAAADAYERASRHADDSRALVLFDLRQDHRYAMGAIRNMLARMHDRGEAPTSRTHDVAVRVAEEVTSLFGTDLALRTLEQGERTILRRLESALDDAEMAPEARTLIVDDLAPRLRTHMRVLESARAS